MKAIKIKENEVKTQADAVLWHLANYGAITSWEAIQQYGATRLADIIYKARKKGYNIDVHTIKTKNRFGRNTSIAKYVYNQPPIQLSKQLGMYCEIDK
tara:strand:- start:6360 stop:6653 length:294 start_codon:yes stop_codon:yes gene_type:complete